MFRSLALPVATLALLCEYVFAQSNAFSNPGVPGVVHDYSTDPIWHIGETKNITWTTSYDLISMVVWQNDNASSLTLIDQQPAQFSLEWQVQIEGVFQLSSGNVFFFEVFEIQSDGSAGDRFSSHYVNITDTPAPVSTTSTTMSTTATSSSTSTPTSSSSGSGGLSTGAEIGIAVAAGLIGLALILAGVLFFLRKRRTNRGTYSQAKGMSDTPPETGYAMEQQYPKTQGGEYFPTSPAPAPAPAYSPYNPNPAPYQQYVPRGMQGNNEGYFQDHKHQMASAPQQTIAEAPAAMQAPPVELSSEQAHVQELPASGR